MSTKYFQQEVLTREEGKVDYFHLPLFNIYTDDVPSEENKENLSCRPTFRRLQLTN